MQLPDKLVAEEARMLHIASMLLESPEAFTGEHRAEHTASVRAQLARRNTENLSLGELEDRAIDAAHERPSVHEAGVEAREALVREARNKFDGGILSSEAEQALELELAQSMRDEQEILAELDHAELAYRDALLLSRIAPKAPYEAPELTELEGEARERAEALLGPLAELQQGAGVEGAEDPADEELPDTGREGKGKDE